jgi:hypothetical protein
MFSVLGFLCFLQEALLNEAMARQEKKIIYAECLHVVEGMCLYYEIP